MSRGDAARLRMPLAFVIGRYFVYVILGTLLTIGVPAMAFERLLGLGVVLPANGGVVGLEGLKAELEAGAAPNGMTIAASYRYAHVAAGGGLLGTDMEGGLLASAERYVAGADPGTGSTGGAYDWSWARVRLPDGSTVALAYNLMPQWADRARRDAWPNPQDLFLWGCGLSTLALVVLVALRASHVLSRKMGPLLAVARAVGRQDLDVRVPSSDVAQVDDVLVAMERMRSSLKASLEGQWAERRRRDAQVAALAHDLKTPLTVIRGNAELLLEEGHGEEARAIAAASRRADGFVARIVEASRGEGGGVARAELALDQAAGRLERAARDVAVACGVGLRCERSAALEVACAGGREVLWDLDLLERAVADLVDNACAYGAGPVTLRFDVDGDFVVLAVEDHGPGFSPEVLAHGTERLFRGDGARAGDDAHFGLGLAIAADAARAHGGSLGLGNTGAGAQTVLRLVLTPGR